MAHLISVMHHAEAEAGFSHERIRERQEEGHFSMPGASTQNAAQKEAVLASQAWGNNEKHFENPSGQSDMRRS